jgi:hypothetical protein
MIKGRLTQARFFGGRVEHAENGKKIFVKYGYYESHGREAQGSLLLGPRLGPDPIPAGGYGGLRT